MFTRMWWRFFIVLLLLTALAAAVLVYSGGSVHRLMDRAWMASRHLNPILHYSLGYTLPGTPDLARLDERLSGKGLKRGAPIFMRIFKSELRLEVWMKQSGRFILFDSYPICTFSGRLGPKLKEGDRQSPEGFYTVARTQLNPNSRWHRSFNLGFPNAYDSHHGRTGSFLMVHGGCASVGCYAMTDAVVGELWALINAALDAGQERFAVHSLPFRLTEARLAAYAGHPWLDFWRELKPGYDLFEAERLPPRISFCKGRYAAQSAGGTGDGSASVVEACTAEATPSG
jgi:murein L,D-transpeptidase YafK